MLRSIYILLTLSFIFNFCHAGNTSDNSKGMTYGKMPTPPPVSDSVCNKPNDTSQKAYKNTDRPLNTLNTPLNSSYRNSNAQPYINNYAYNDGMRRKDYLLATLELGAGLGAYTTSYYVKKNKNARDFDFDFKSSMKYRLNNQAMRFDDNRFNINKGHLYAGWAYYSVGRLNGLNRLTSLLYATIGSSEWEYVTEYKEVVGINDHINTIFGGLTLGETYFEILKIFQSAPDAFYTKSIGTVYAAPKIVLDWISKTTHGESPYLIADYKPDIWAKLDFHLGKYSANYSLPTFNPSNKLTGIKWGVNAQVVDMPAFEKPGHRDEIITDDVFAQFLIENNSNENRHPHLDVFKFHAKTTLGAYYLKNLSRDSHNNLQGYNLFIGPSTALDIRNDQPLNDFYTALHILGATIDLTGYAHGARVRVVLDVYGDFDMMKAYGFPSYAATHDVAHLQSVLKYQHYYYGMGYTKDAWVNINIGRLELGALVYQINSNLIPNRSRFFADPNTRPFCDMNQPNQKKCQVESTRINAFDQRTNLSLWASFKIIDKLKIQIGLEDNHILGSMAGSKNTRASLLQKSVALVFSLRS